MSNDQAVGKGGRKQYDALTVFEINKKLPIRKQCDALTVFEIMNEKIILKN